MPVIDATEAFYVATQAEKVKHKDSSEWLKQMPKVLEEGCPEISEFSRTLR